MGKRNQLTSRTADEQAEGSKMLDSNVPGTRFQTSQQVDKPVEQNMSAEPEQNSFVPKKSGSKGSQLKQEQVAEVITGVGGSAAAEAGMSSPSRAGLRTLAYSGNEGTILGNPSGTPVVGAPSRSDTRPGQKLDAVAKAIDFIASEQVIQEIDGSKPLQDNPDSPQGFLGHPENISARVQKIAEPVPGALLYARSCDEIMRDEIAYVNGQMIRESGINANCDPTKTYDPITREYVPYHSVRGNYIPKTMHIGVNAAGSIVSMSFDVDDVSITVDNNTVNRSSTAFIRAMNLDEINRQNMEKKAGIETEKNWCPLVRAIEQPTQTVGRLTDDELTTGSELFMAYRFINKASSYFFNKAAKDGQTPYRSFKEMLKGNSVCFQNSNNIFNTGVYFDRADYVNGAPSLMIALYDSIAKFTKRGDLLVQPRSWKMHKQTADNNINPFKVNPTFAKYIAARDVFSTIDRGYDPYLPVCISDNWRLSHVLNFNELLNFTKGSVFTLQLGGKGVTTAGTAFDNIYDDLKSAAPSKNVSAILHPYASGSAKSGDIYGSNGLNYSGSKNYGSSKIIIVGDKLGYDDYDSGLAAALLALDAYDHSGNHAQLHPVVLLFKVDDTVDKVYAVCRYPNYISVNTTSVDIQLHINYDTTSDYMTSDASKDTVYVRTDDLACDQFCYKYQNRQNPYIVEVRNPLLFGIKEWATNLGPKLANPSASDGASSAASLRDSQGILWYDIPIVHSTTNLSLWDLIVCASVPFMQKIRTNSEFDVLNYEDLNGSYPFSQLVNISEANPLASENFSMTDILQPLKVGMMKPATAISWIMPEKFWRVDHTFSSPNMSAEKFVLPYYFSEEQLTWTPGVTLAAAEKQDGFLMNYPSTRAGARSAYLDDFYGMSERDIRLCLDMMTIVPGYQRSVLNRPAPYGVYKYGLSNSGIPTFVYSTSGQLNIDCYLTTPRELGLGCVAPAGYNSPLVSKYYANNRVAASDYSTLTSLISTGSSYVVRTWHVLDGNYQALHNPLSVVVTRGGNFAQDWAKRGDVIYADTANTTVEVYGALNAPVNIGLCLNFNDAMEVTAGTMAGENGVSAFHPFTDGTLTNINDSPLIITLQNVLWPRLQVLPFALSPFDQTPEGRYVDAAHVTVDMTADPYDFMYIFGFAGFKASDFREDVYNRIYEKQTLGWTYVSDPFVTASPILK